MKRVLLSVSLVLLALPACQLPAEHEPLRLLPEDRGAVPYAELLTRARLQSTLATEAYYTDKWPELQDAATGLEQTARFLTKAQDVPVKQKDTLPKMSEELAKQAVLLRDAAKEKNEAKVKETLTRVMSMVRELRLDQ
jgi:hypothetical protein